jgi:hypothetical protein
MRKIRMLLVASFAAVPLAAITAGPAAACPGHACVGQGICWVNRPVTVTHDAIFFHDGPLVGCQT